MFWEKLAIMSLCNGHGRPQEGALAPSPLKIKMSNFFLCLNLQNKSKYIYLNYEDNLLESFFFNLVQGVGAAVASLGERPAPGVIILE